ncbi:MAG: ribulose-phosphate 3-epimerase [Candidatus Delongbacteria bacterium]|nr:ribulose-phosphate 3-epimerase [Candidatus Delongbacteria bacterium]MBN2833586.1 ribulose-phosphate 3-epimerase [Candidatus Delongbacteria bacterium]
MIYVSPSLLSADFSNLGKDIKSCEESGADYLHLDIMDGHFVPNITFGPFVVDFCNKVSDLPLDVHLMIEKPELYIPDFVKAGADIITIHAETVTHLHRQIQFIKSFNVKAAVALNPATPLGVIDYVIEELDMILFMTVNPGFSGQKFIPAVVDKLQLFKENYLSHLKNDFLVQIDGGVDDTTHKVLKDNGANMLVSGSYFFKQSDRKRAIDILKS